MNESLQEQIYKAIWLMQQRCAGAALARTKAVEKEDFTLAAYLDAKYAGLRDALVKCGVAGLTDMDGNKPAWFITAITKLRKEQEK